MDDILYYRRGNKCVITPPPLAAGRNTTSLPQRFTQWTAFLLAANEKDNRTLRAPVFLLSDAGKRAR